MKIKKDDTIKVMTGADKGKEGRVIKIYPNADKILVEGIKIVKKHVRPNQENPQGGILEKEMPIHISNVALIVNGNHSRIGYKTLEDGKKVRYLKKTNEVI